MCKEIIEREYISKRHIKNIEDIIREKKLIIGFRNTGKDVIMRINSYPQIAKKPHAILDKSLKEDDFKGFDNELKNKYVALIPYRKGNFIDGEPVGLYLSKYGQEKLQKELNTKKIIFEKNSDKATFVTIPGYNEGNAQEVFKKLLSTLNEIIKSEDQNYYLKFFVTGDYDIHDIIENHAIVPSSNTKKDVESPEKRILNWLSIGCIKGIEEIRNNAKSYDWLKNFDPVEDSPIQHGCQYNYIAHMMNNEKEKEIVLKVARYDNDVALYDGKKWEIIKNKDLKVQADKLSEYYNKHGLKLKWTWTDENNAESFIHRAGKNSI